MQRNFNLSIFLESKSIPDKIYMNLFKDVTITVEIFDAKKIKWTHVTIWISDDSKRDNILKHG